MSVNERDVVRDLARQVMAIANEPRMAAIKQRWRDVNALRRPDRAPVWCRPVGCWKEILPRSDLVCGEPWLQGLEYHFRQIICKRVIDDDTPVEPFFNVSAAFNRDPANIWGVDTPKHSSEEKDGAWGYDPPLKNESDYDRLRMPQFTYNRSGTEENVERHRDLFGDILPVNLTAGVPLSGTLGTAAADLRGLAEMMMDMVVAPELVHRLMSFLRDSMLAAMDVVAATGLLEPNNNGPMTCSDSIGDQLGGKRGYGNMWIMLNSQEFDQVSPDMWREFCLEYQRPIMERYGLVAYGCCENLTHKIDGVLSIPNLRVFTCSAWTDLGAVQERVGQDYCIMWRQKASDVVFPDDVRVIRDDLNAGAKQLQGYYYQIVLRELQTLAGHKDRLAVWTRLAKAAAEKYA